MSYLLFFLYAAAIFWIIPRIPFFKKSGIAIKWLLLLFAARALTGVLVCYLSYHYFTVSDSLNFHNIGLNQYYLLTHLPNEFFVDIFRNPFHNHYAGLFDVTQSFWNNLKLTVIVKGIALADVITLRNFYTNTLLFNFIIFFGSVAIYRVFRDLYTGNKLVLLIVVFLFPSSLYFTSALHRDGLVFLSVSMIIYLMNRIMVSGFSTKRLLFLMLFFLLIFTLRNFVSMVMIPALIAWWLALRKPRYVTTVFSLIFLVSVIIFFASKYLVPVADFPRFVSERRESFDAISKTSNTYLPLGVLDPSFTGFLTGLPISFYHAFCLPAIWSFPNLLSLPFAFELLLVWILFILFLLRRKKNSRPQLFYFITFFCLINILMIGYTVPNLGAILRYRSIYMHLLSVCLFVSIDWKFLKTKLQSVP